MNDVIDQLNGPGYAVIENRLSPLELWHMRIAYGRVLCRIKREGSVHERLPRLLVEDPTFWRLLTDDLVLQVADQFFGTRGYICSSFSGNTLFPGADRIAWHRDYPYWAVPEEVSLASNTRLSLQTMWAIDDFTEENGATMVRPGSHLGPGASPISLTCPAGSLIIFDSRLIHSAASNKSNKMRRMAGSTLILSCVIPMEDMPNQLLDMAKAYPWCADEIKEFAWLLGADQRVPCDISSSSYEKAVADRMVRTKLNKILSQEEE